MRNVRKSLIAAVLAPTMALLALQGATAADAPTGPDLVQDIYPTGNAEPRSLVPVGDSLFFSAVDTVVNGTGNRELWVSDGTTSGTRLVKDVCPGSQESMRIIGDVHTDAPQRKIVPFGSGVIFIAYDCDYSEELWKSDGTEAGTIEISNLTAPGVTFPITTTSLTSIGSHVLFFYETPSAGTELWRTDGTSSGTVMVKDIRPGASSSVFANVPDVTQTYVFDNEMYFIATDGTNGYELWKSDGTESGTVMVKNITSGNSSTFDSNSRIHYVEMAGALYFTVNYSSNTGWALWKTDGTDAGTVQVSTKVTVNSMFARYLVTTGTLLFFVANDGTDGYELWKSDGTESGTVMVKNIRAVSADGMQVFNDIGYLEAIGSTVYFSANDGVHGYELWKSDGTESGTQLVADLVTGSTGSSPNRFTSFGGSIYFAAETEIDDERDELWKLTGSTVEKVLFEQSPMLQPTFLTVQNNRLYFVAETQTYGEELYVMSLPPEPEQNQTPAPAVTTTVTPTTTTTTVSKVKKLSKLPETGSSHSLFVFAAIALTLGGAVTIARKRLLN